MFEKVLNIDDKHVRAFKNYFLITKVNSENQYFKMLEKLNLSEASYEDKIFVYTSLSKCNFDLNNSDKALKYLEDLNNLKKSNSNFSIGEEKKLFENIQKLFLKKFNVSIVHESKLKFTPVFILGMPRSGTTLFEQVISSHSKIHGAFGELFIYLKLLNNLKLTTKNLM